MIYIFYQAISTYRLNWFKPYEQLKETNSKTGQCETSYRRMDHYAADPNFYIVVYT